MKVKFMFVFFMSLLLNIALAVAVYDQYKHIKRLQDLIQPLDPIDFEDSERWLDCISEIGDKYE